MNAFRSFTPKRRKITTSVKHHGDHRADLKLDYKDRCGWCNDIDTWRVTWFEIDHFVPQKYLKKISHTDYSNLVYACRSCNNAKRFKWPTKDEAIHNINDVGFIDPCDDSYNDQFSRHHDGRISYKTRLGGWIYKSLKFYKPQHEIIWNIELLDNYINEIEELLKVASDTVLADRLTVCYKEFRKYVKELNKVGT